WSSPTTWNEFLPISIPIVAMVAIDLLDMAVLRLTLAPSQHHSPVGQEHGRTIPLAEVPTAQEPSIVLLRRLRGTVVTEVYYLCGRAPKYRRPDRMQDV